MVIYMLGQMPPLSVLTASVEITVSDVRLLEHEETGGWHSGGLSGHSKGYEYTCSGLSLP